MGVFRPQDVPFYQTSYMGFWIKIYPSHITFKAGTGSQSIPLNQIASIQSGMLGIRQITLESAGGQKYSIPTNKKKEVQEAIYTAQAYFARNSHYPVGNGQYSVGYNQHPTGNNQYSVSAADEIIKLNGLKEKGIITEEEFDKKKKQLLGL